MSGVTRGNPGVLRNLGVRLDGTVRTGFGPVARYNAAIQALNSSAMSPEVSISLPSRAGNVDAVLEDLGVADRQLLALADALEWADQSIPGFDAFGSEVRADIGLALLELLANGGSWDESASVARILGEHVVEHAQGLLDGDSPTMEDLERLAGMLDILGQNDLAAATFFNQLGPQSTLAFVGRIERSYQFSDLAQQDPPDTSAAWGVLLSLSSAFAAASHSVGRPGGLSDEFVGDLLAIPDRGPYQHRHERYGRIGLLFAAGGFSDDALLPLAGLAPDVLSHRPGYPWRNSTWGEFTDPALTWMFALSQSPMASASEPRLLAQLLATGSLSIDALDLALIEAARRTDADAGYADDLTDELLRLGVITDEDAGQFASELGALGVSVDVAGVTADSLHDLWQQVLGADDPSSVRQPGWLADVADHRGFTITRRVLPVAGLGVDVLSHLDDGRDLDEALVRAGVTAGGATAGAGIAAKFGSPLLAGGPPGWVGYGVLVLGAGFAGGTAGGALGDAMFSGSEERRLWFRDIGRQPVQAPRPPEQMQWQ